MDHHIQNAANAIALLRVMIDFKISERGLSSRIGIFELYRECFAVVTDQSAPKDRT